MPIIVATEIKTAVAWGRIVPVSCEKCRTAFYYELVRVGVGKASALYGIGEEGASSRASDAATRDLAGRLDEEAELVACPKCNWVNQDLVDRYRRRLYRRAPLLIAIVVVAGLVISPIVAAGLSEALGYQSYVPRYVTLALFAVCFSSPAWILLLRRSLRSRIDPNATHPRRPVVPPGTPPALVEHRDRKTGAAHLVPAMPASADVGDRRNREWAVYRPGQVEFPNVCCCCLAPATTAFRPVLAVNAGGDLPVPLCAQCSSRCAMRWWISLLVVAVASFAIAGLIALVGPGFDTVGRWAFFGIIGSFGSLIGGVVIAGKMCRPYKLRITDADRGIFRFAAEHPGFTAMLNEQIDASEGRIPRSGTGRR